MEHAGGNGWASDAAQAAPLLERGRPLERADALLASAREGHGYVLGLEGPAGIGKTSLLDAVVNRAPDFDVLRATGAPFEREFEFGLVRDLFEGQGDELAFGPRGRLSPAECGDRVRELFGFAYTRASMRPVLVAIDDLHWADEHSLRFLAYLGTHVASLPIAVVLSWRPAALSSAPIADLLETIEDRHTLAPLSEAATAELLELARAGYGRAATCCHAATAGNPWLVVESCRALVDDARSDPEPLERVIDALTPRAVASTVTLRIQALGAEAVSFAQAVAILGEDARMRLAAALGGLDLAAAACASELLTRADLMAPTSPLRFSAPIVRNAVYGSIAPSQRSLLHGEAAWLIAGAGATQDAVADHLLLSEPADDPETVAVLQATAGRALAAGSALRAARYLERALAEPPPAGARHGVLLELGALEARMCLAGAESHLVEVLEAGSLQAGSGGALRARAALELADLRLLTGRFKESLCDSQLPKCDEEAALRAELAFCSIAANDPLPSGWWRAELASSGDETPDERAWTAAAVCAATLDGEPVSLTLPAAERAFAAGMLAPVPTAAGAAMIALCALQAGGHEALAERVVERGLQAARASGSVVAGAVSSTISARLLLARGSLVAAEGSARHALRVSRANGLRLLEPFALASLLESLLDQGRADDAEHELADDAAGRASCEGLGGCLLLIARGRLRGSRADTELGLADVLTAGARLLQASCSTPGFDWHSRAALLAHRLDRRREAARLVDDELALAERLGAPRPLGVALRARALVSPPGTQIELLTAAVETLRGTPARLDFARALCDLGSAHRRSGSRRDAPGPLRAGLQLAHECGASALAERARQELVVLGARPRRHAVTGIDALTARELQASELAAEGLTNRQIAAAMSVTANTVEYHLTNAYRKLGIETRERLGGALGRGLVGGRGRAVVVDLG